MKQAIRNFIHRLLHSKKPSDYLRMARKHIENGDCDYICVALRAVGRTTSGVERGATIKLRIEVMNRLEGHSTLCRWAYATGRIGHREMTSDLFMRRYRMAYLDQMIAEYEAKGD